VGRGRDGRDEQVLAPPNALQFWQRQINSGLP
jgi:hypothetical protein